MQKVPQQTVDATMGAAFIAGFFATVFILLAVLAAFGFAVFFTVLGGGFATFALILAVVLIRYKRRIARNKDASAVTVLSVANQRDKLRDELRSLVTACDGRQAHPVAAAAVMQAKEVLAVMDAAT